MKKRTTLNHNLLGEVKKAFVAMPGGADPSLGAGPVAGGGMLTQAQASPMGGTPPMDPAMAGGAPPMDPSMGGMPPMDPSMMGGMPPMDPSMMGGIPPAEGGAGGQVTMSSQEFTDLLVTLITVLGGGKPAKPAAKPKGEGESAPAAAAAPAAGGEAGAGDTNAKLDQIITILSGNMAGGEPPAPPMGGGAPAGPEMGGMPPPGMGM